MRVRVCLGMEGMGVGWGLRASMSSFLVLVIVGLCFFAAGSTNINL